MSFIPFRKIVTKDSDTNRLQDNTNKSITSILQNTRLDSQTIPNQTLYPFGVNIINHGLNRQLVGWSIVRKNAASEIWDMQNNNTLQGKTLWLITSDQVTVSVEVW